jgi:endonuclease YncB( thermonuclease family)
MTQFKFRYTPEALAYGDKPHWVSSTDGDTPTVTIPVRMLGMDAPELHYGGATEKNPGKLDAAMEGFLAGAGAGLDPGLRKHLAKCLVHQPSTRQILAGKAAWEHFEALAKARLDRGVAKNGKPRVPRSLFCMASKEVFDRYGRLLAYVNASYEKKEREEIPAAQRPTFNLEMLEDGHGVSLLIYPNIPKPADLKLVQSAVRVARTKGRGFWIQGEEVLLPYEFRWIADTISGKRSGPDRYCADISTAKLYAPQRYHEVLPENRLFFFAEHLVEALSMGLLLVP